MKLSAASPRIEHMFEDGAGPGEAGGQAPTTPPIRDTEVPSVPTVWGSSNPLDVLEPGPELAALLGSLDERVLGGYDLVSFLSGCERLVSWAQARQLAGIRELARRRPSLTARTPADPGDTRGR
ncbi:MAG: hypothetical protein QOJ90_895, partial [Actinomycetota bacterium]|nr:hypothetical protein [Actinomycetota bacterium]